MHDDSHTGADPALDLIRRDIPGDKPHWTENIAFWMHDARAGVQLYAHLGRMQPDRSIWEGLSIIFLPDGAVLVNRSLGVSVAEARNTEYHYRPVVPNELWSFAFQGVAQRVDAHELRRRAIGDESHEAVSYDLVFEAVQPVFNMHASDSNAERMHLEQGGRVKGVFVVDGARVLIDCTGYRDHSVSQRTFTTLDSETWANCVFPSGRVFSLLEVSRGDKRVLEGQVYRDGRMQLAKPVRVPDLTDTTGSPHAFAISLETAGKVIEIEAETRPSRFLPFNLLRPTGMRPGIDTSDASGMVAVQCPTQYRWDGEIGYGWLERTRRLSDLDNYSA
jgi:hypothetical protein